MDAAAPPSRGGEVSWATTALFRKVAHDIVGTAGVARGAIEELSRGTGADASSQSTMFDLARRSLARLDRLARRLRLAALAQEGTLIASRGSVDLEALVDAAIADAVALDARKAVQLDRAERGSKVLVDVDRDLMVTAVSELVSNALRFARKRVHVAVERAGAGAIVVVEDDGPGWPAGMAEAIFPILRDRPGQRGSGVSLPIVAVIAREHGGGLHLRPSSLADSQGRHGACARLELPVVA